MMLHDTVAGTIIPMSTTDGVPPILSNKRPAGRLITRKTDKFMRNPPTVRGAAGVIVTVTVIIVVISGVAMWVFDHREFPTLGVALWWAIQTATTVGYGDVTPRDAVGRLIASVVMLEGIAFIAVITAAITSAFVTRAQTELRAAAKRDTTPTLVEIDERLRRIEELLAQRQEQ